MPPLLGLKFQQIVRAASRASVARRARGHAQPLAGDDHIFALEPTHPLLRGKCGASDIGFVRSLWCVYLRLKVGRRKCRSNDLGTCCDRVSHQVALTPMTQATDRHESLVSTAVMKLKVEVLPQFGTQFKFICTEALTQCGSHKLAALPWREYSSH